MQKTVEILEFDSSNKRHFLYDEVKRLFYAMRETQPEDVDDDSLEEFINAIAKVD